ncbi:MAG: lipopolysaccharide exporter [Solirubrobacteraceae bacterium]|nr:lipopolysaccharide exporter [Solirubrobacteraceae bacterium]
MSDLRRRTVRGAAITAAFVIGIDAIVAAQGLVVTRLLGPRAIGLYGLVAVTVMTILTLKRVGIDEAFVQQETEDPEAEFQYAFTLELVLSAALALVIVVLAPILAAAYGEPRLLWLTLASAYLPLAFALLAPLWIFYRRMDYARQRLLQVIQPVVSIAVTLPLAATGFGVWSLVVGPAAGYACAVAASLAASPYRLKLRFDRAVAKRYVRFSGWVLVALAASMAVAQGQIVAFKIHGGLAAAGYLTLAATVTRYVDRADQIVTATIYPAIVAIRGRADALQELFEKSNRATLLWVLPFTCGVVLFAPDLVSFVLGKEWGPARVLLQGLAVAGLLQHLGFNWFAFFRAHGDPKHPALEAIAGTIAFGAFALGGLAVWGVDGFVWGRILAVAVALVVRWRFIRLLLPRARLSTIVAPALVPVVAAAGAVLALRALLWGAERPLVQALAEALLFAGIYAGWAAWRERPLVAELLRSVRPPAGPAAAPVQPASPPAPVPPA